MKENCRVLFVNACPRGADSRTLRLCRAFLEEARAALPRMCLIERDLNTSGLRSVDAGILAVKEACCDARDWSSPLFEAARELRGADAVVIGAPYWDLSFPSILKVWVENVYARGLTFRYEEDRPVGLCAGKAACYITTAGGPIGDEDWGTGYLHAVLRTLGIPSFECFSADALDLEHTDTERVMKEAERSVRRTARAWCARLTEL